MLTTVVALFASVTSLVSGFRVVVEIDSAPEWPGHAILGPGTVVLENGADWARIYVRGRVAIEWHSGKHSVLRLIGVSLTDKDLFLTDTPGIQTVEFDLLSSLLCGLEVGCKKTDLTYDAIVRSGRPTGTGTIEVEGKREAVAYTAAFAKRSAHGPSLRSFRIVRSDDIGGQIVSWKVKKCQAGRFAAVAPFHIGRMDESGPYAAWRLPLKSTPKAK